MNNSATQSTTVITLTQADLAVTKSDSPDPVLMDTLPANVTFGAATASQGSCSEASGVVTCDLGTISNGASVTASITVTPTVPPAAPPLPTRPVSHPLWPDPVSSNNSASQNTTVIKLADL